MAMSVKIGSAVSVTRVSRAAQPMQSSMLRQATLPTLQTSFSAVRQPKTLRADSTTTRATAKEDIDFDKILSDLGDKFEASENKAAIVAYSAAAIAALWFSEWLIHLPLLNFLLGFPIQLLGLGLLPYFGVKYLVEKDSISSDAGDAFNKVVRRLPGLEK